MNLIALWQTLWRHKLAVLPMLLLTAFGLGAVVFLKAPTYRSGGSIVLLNPPAVPPRIAGVETTDFSDDNPLVRFGDLSVVVDIISRRMESLPIKQELLAQGVTAYTIAANIDFLRGPIIEITADSISPVGAVNATKAVIARMKQELADMQKGFKVKEAYWIATADVEVPSTGSRVLSSTLRTGIGIAGLGGMATVAVALIAESFGRKRRRRRLADAVNRPSVNLLDPGLHGDQESWPEPAPASR